jgi:DNA-3-methyladenine glycosylase
VATHLPGAVYVTINYGLHWLLNVLASDGIVLIRAIQRTAGIQPTAGIETMAARRNQARETARCSGPGRLGQALSLSPADHGSSLLTADRYVISRDALFDSSRIVADVRVGLSRAVDRPWHFLLSDNPDVSVPHAAH